MNYYSQNCEDEEFILPYFQRHTGVFAELGCNDGKTLSNTRALYELGWEGVLLDASPIAFDRLKENYPSDLRVELHNYALGSFDGHVKFHESGELLGKGDVALVSSIKPEEVSRWDSLHIPFHEITVPIKTWDSFLKESKYKKFDFISIDIEGEDLGILQQMNLEELGTQMLMVEYNGKDQYSYDIIMFEQGFKLLHKNAENLIYCL